MIILLNVRFKYQNNSSYHRSGVAASLLVQKGYDVVILERQLSSIKIAVFSNNRDTASIDFREKFTSGYSTTYQVRRDKFDKILADKCE